MEALTRVEAVVYREAQEDEEEKKQRDVKPRDDELKNVKQRDVKLKQDQEEDNIDSSSLTSTYGKCTCASQKYLQNDHSYRASS